MWKLDTKSLGGAQYFVTFIDDATRYIWVYFLKGMLSCFLEWKTLVERTSGKQLKVLRSDNAGEYTSEEFMKHLK